MQSNMTVALIILIVGIAFNVLLGTLVILKYRDKTARALVFVALGLILWELANYMADTPANPLWWNRLTFLGPLMVGIASYIFLSNLRGQTAGYLERVALRVGTLFVAILCFTPLIVPEVVPRMFEDVIVGYNPERGAFYPVYLAWIGFLIVLLVIKAFSPVRRKSALLKAQMSLVRTGMIGVLVIPLITSVVVPIISNSSASTQYVPLMSIFYMGALTIAILKHKMLDIHDFIIRATAFSFSSAVLGVVYVAPGILLLLWVLGIEFNAYTIVLGIVIGSIIAANYHRVQRWFVRVTNRVFFRDNYEPAQLMAELNKGLLVTIDLERIFATTARVMTSYLKPEFVGFVATLRGDLNQKVYMYGTQAKWVQSHIDELLPQFDRSTDKHQVASAETQENELPHELLEQQDIAAVTRLYVTKEKLKVTIGYMIVGRRKSGKAYSSVDMTVLETMSNTLAIAVQDALHYEEIKSFNATLQSKVNEATGELRASNKMLKELDESKDEFISMASHQLRTPLTTVKGYISMLLDGDVGKVTPEQRKLLEEAFSSSQRMVYLIGDFLNVSRLQTGKFELETHAVDMATIVQQEVDQMQESARSRDITIVYERPENIPQMSIDENKIRQVIMNFLDNALYYSHPNSTIEVQLARHSDRVSLRVKDHGIGVPQSERHRLFAKFYRASNAKRQRPDGTGIGLFMARKVVAAHGGSIIFESQEGKGSTFGFRLPVKPLER